MKKAVVSALVFAGSAMLLTAQGAVAWPNYTGTCTGCHPQDVAVTLTVNQMSCMPDGQKGIDLSVSNTYPGFEGWAVFDPQVNIKNGYGSHASFVLPSGRTYQIFGVSGYGSWQTAQMGGANQVYVVPTCPPSGCVNNDTDTFSVSGGSCGPVDCNDADGSIFPGAAETKHDGIDQDCNGYDLTIEVVKAVYDAKKTKLTVQATSGFGAAANLTVAGFGPMTYARRTGLWTLSVATSPKPPSVTVSGFEGAQTVTIP